MAAISVCIPTYNRGAILPFVIRSILAQTCPDWELVVGDDCSTDGTWAYLQSLNDPRIRVFRQPENRGIIANWNAVVRHAASGVVLKLDDDDYVAPDFIESVLPFFGQPNVVCVFTGFGYAADYDYKAQRVVVDSGELGRKGRVTGAELIRQFLFHSPFPGIHPSAIVFRKSAWESVGGYRKRFGDHMGALAIAAQGDVGYVPRPLFYYVQHAGERASATLDYEQTKRNIRSYDPLNLAKSVFEVEDNPVRAVALSFADAATLYRRHLVLYSCIFLYLVRNNNQSRTLTAYAFASLARRFPRLLLAPKYWAAGIAMLMPMGLVRWLEKLYRSRAF